MELNIWLKGLLVILMGVIGVASRFLLKQKPDNTIEQIAEAGIKRETGIDIDLSPDVDGEEDGNK